MPHPNIVYSSHADHEISQIVGPYISLHDLLVQSRLPHLPHLILVHVSGQLAQELSGRQHQIVHMTRVHLMRHAVELHHCFADAVLPYINPPRRLLFR